MKEAMRRLRNYGIFVSMLAVALLGSYQYLSGYTTVSNNVNGKEMPICSVETKEKKVALTFESAWGDEDIARILEILKKQEVRATFFLTGEWVEEYPEGVKAIRDAGHDIGNHSESHRSMGSLNEEEQKEEIMSVHRKVEELTGVRMDLFRLPYDNYDDTVIRNLQSCGYYPIQWSVDSFDWKDYGADSIQEVVLSHERLDNGAIILLHSGTKYTADALEALITGIKEKGYQIVPVSELIYREEYHLDVTGRQIKD